MTASQRGLAIHRSMVHGRTAQPKTTSWKPTEQIPGVQGEVDMTCWCGERTYSVPASWVSRTAPSCDDGCYRRFRPAGA